MKRALFIVSAVIIAYLTITFGIGVFAEYRFRAQLASTLQLMSMSSFKVTSSLASEMRGNKRLHRFTPVLKATPPIGWFILHRMQHVEDGVVYASQSMAQSQKSRFQDESKARLYGFDPEKKSDNDIIEQTMTLVW